MRKKKPQRAKCWSCGRRRLTKFLEWNPGVLEWQCTDNESCRYHLQQWHRKPWPPSDDWGM